MQSIQTWQWILANFAFPVFFAAIVLWAYYQKDKVSVPKDVYMSNSQGLKELQTCIEASTDVITQVLTDQQRFGEIASLMVQQSSEIHQQLIHIVELQNKHHELMLELRRMNGKGVG